MKFKAAIFALYHDEHFLLLKRSFEDRWYAGCWNFPGGKTDEGETSDEAAFRELHEEAGILLPHPEIQICDFSLTVPTAKRAILDVYYGICANKIVPTLNDEHSAYAWLTLSDLITLHTRKEATPSTLTIAENFLRVHK
jgi:mutator protein MutT